MSQRMDNGPDTLSWAFCSLGAYAPTMAAAKDRWKPEPVLSSVPSEETRSRLRAKRKKRKR